MRSFSTSLRSLALADGRAARLHDGSCMSREAHVQFCDSGRADSGIVSDTASRQWILFLSPSGGFHVQPPALSLEGFLP